MEVQVTVKRAEVKSVKVRSVKVRSVGRMDKAVTKLFADDRAVL
jgi:hypothetical protein